MQFRNGNSVLAYLSSPKQHSCSGFLAKFEDLKEVRDGMVLEYVMSNAEQNEKHEMHDPLATCVKS